MMDLLSLNYLLPHEPGMFAVEQKFNTVGVICFTPPPYIQPKSKQLRPRNHRLPTRLGMSRTY